MNGSILTRIWLKEFVWISDADFKVNANEIGLAKQISYSDKVKRKNLYLLSISNETKA